MKIGIIDTKSANFNSIVQALKRLNVDVVVSDDITVLGPCHKLILPGVGTAAAVMKGMLMNSPYCIDELLHKDVEPFSELIALVQGFPRPILGICLGMQILATRSKEVPIECNHNHINTIDIVKGTVHKIDVSPYAQLDEAEGNGLDAVMIGKYNPRKMPSLPLPHMGWNTVHHNDHPLFKGIENDSYFYFVHSYCLDVVEETIGTTIYGQEFSAAIAKGNIMGVQFHPEKSGANGQRLLQNFIDL